MDTIIMNLILLAAILSLGYYILDAFVSLFMYKSSPNNRTKRRKSSSRSYQEIEYNKRANRMDKPLKRVVNS